MTMTSVEPTTVTTSTAEPTTLTTTTAKPTYYCCADNSDDDYYCRADNSHDDYFCELTTSFSITTAVPTTATTTSSKPASVITTETATHDFKLDSSLSYIEYTSEVPLSTVDGPTSRNHSVTASSSRIRSKRGSAFENQYYEFKLSPWPFVGMWTIACIALMCILLACFVVGNKRKTEPREVKMHSHFKEDNTTEPEV
uniref:Uncharacterized protein n=1 Tax=Ditylenchus dipsaci TaxID=166011 RepID=A0A915DW16_9BILA